MDDGLPRIGEILELSLMELQAMTMRFEVIAVDPCTGVMEAKACEPNSNGEHWYIRMRLQRLQ
jgi:hypothetical protein